MNNAKRTGMGVLAVFGAATTEAPVAYVVPVAATAIATTMIVTPQDADAQALVGPIVVGSNGTGGTPVTTTPTTCPNGGSAGGPGCGQPPVVIGPTTPTPAPVQTTTVTANPTATATATSGAIAGSSSISHGGDALAVTGPVTATTGPSTATTGAVTANPTATATTAPVTANPTATATTAPVTANPTATATTAPVTVAGNNSSYTSKYVAAANAIDNNVVNTVICGRGGGVGIGTRGLTLSGNLISTDQKCLAGYQTRDNPKVVFRAGIETGNSELAAVGLDALGRQNKDLGDSIDNPRADLTRRFFNAGNTPPPPPPPPPAAVQITPEGALLGGGRAEIRDVKCPTGYTFNKVTYACEGGTYAPR